MDGLGQIGIARAVKRLLNVGLLIVAAYLGYRFLFHYTFGSDHYILGFSALWLATAYIFIPRVHRILTKLYLPDYYIGRSRTGDGLLADPVNLAFVGTRSQIIDSMKQAGWVRADELNLRTSIKMIKNSVLRRSYKTAPVSSLFLFSRKQDLAFQQEVGGTTSKRHHVRFWKCPNDWYLPGGARADWLAAASFDRRVGLSTFTLQITHKIEAEIDQERDYVISTLKESGAPISVRVANNFSNAYHDRNGGGDRIRTDGALPFVTFK